MRRCKLIANALWCAAGTDAMHGFQTVVAGVCQRAPQQVDLAAQHIAFALAVGPQQRLEFRQRVTTRPGSRSRQSRICIGRGGDAPACPHRHRSGTAVQVKRSGR